MLVRQEQTNITASGSGGDYDIAPYSGYVESTYQKIADSAGHVTSSGTVPFITTQSGIDPTASGHLATKYYTDTLVTSTSGNLQDQIDAIEVGAVGSGINSYSVCMLKGLGGNMNETFYELSPTNLGDNHPVNGVSGALCVPSESGVMDSALVINGFAYNIDSYIDASGDSQPGIYGTITSSGGFSLDFQTTYVKIKWNYTGYSGFDLTEKDDLTFRY